jgi:hypothetical protein
LDPGESDGGIGDQGEHRLEKPETGPEHCHSNHRSMELDALHVLQRGSDVDFVGRHVGEGFGNEEVAETLGCLAELRWLGLGAAEDREQIGGERVIEDGERHVRQG